MVSSRSSARSGPAAKLHFYCLLLTLCLWTHMHFPSYAWGGPRDCYTLSLCAHLSDWKKGKIAPPWSSPQRRHVALGDCRCCWRDKEASSLSHFDSHPGGGSSCHWFKAHPPSPVIGRPCWRQILLYVFQMVEADDEADEARLIYRRPRFGYGSWFTFPLFLTTKLLYCLVVKNYYSLKHSCLLSTAIYSAVHCSPTAAINQPSANVVKHSLHFFSPPIWIKSWCFSVQLLALI